MKVNPKIPTSLISPFEASQILAWIFFSGAVMFWQLHPALFCVYLLYATQFLRLRALEEGELAVGVLRSLDRIVCLSLGQVICPMNRYFYPHEAGIV